jgi:hypothetical protein
MYCAFALPFCTSIVRGRPNARSRIAVAAATRALSDLPVVAIVTRASIACGAYFLASASISMTYSVFLGRPRGLLKFLLQTALFSIALEAD